MGCIPLTTWDRHAMKAKFFLHGIGTRADKPQCTDLEKTIVGTINLLSDIGSLVLPISKRIGEIKVGGSSDVGSFVAETFERNLKGVLKVDLGKFGQFVDLAVNKAYQGLNGDTRAMIDYIGWREFLKYNKGAQEIFTRFKEGRLTKYEMNWIYFVKAKQDRNIKVRGNYSQERDIIYVFKTRVGANARGYRIGSKDQQFFVTHAIAVDDWINTISLEQFDTVVDKDGNETVKTIKTNKQLALSKAAIPLAAVAGLLFLRK